MNYHKKQHKDKKNNKNNKDHKESKKLKEPKESKENNKHKKCGCECEQKFYFPLPNIPSQPVGGERVKVDSWFAPGSVQSCCSICSSVKPVYANPCNTCRYDKGVYPINNSAYFTNGQYVY